MGLSPTPPFTPRNRLQKDFETSKGQNIFDGTVQKSALEFRNFCQHFGCASRDCPPRPRDRPMVISPLKGVGEILRNLRFWGLK